MKEIIINILIPITAAFIGAISAFWYQKRLENRRDKKAVIQTLMIYRNAGAESIEWINALNAIDLVFYDNKEVKELYHKFIHQMHPDRIKNYNWLETFYELVSKMAKCSGYKNLTMMEIKDYYQPVSLKTHYPHMMTYDSPTPPKPSDLEQTNKEQ